MISIIKFSKKYLRPYRMLVLIYLFTNLVITAADLAILYSLGVFIDKLISKSVNIVNFGLLLLGLYATIIIFGFLKERVHLLLNLDPSNKMNIEGIKKLQKTSTINNILADSAYLNRRLNDDSKNIVSFYIDLLQNLLVNCIKFIVPITIFFVFDITLGFVLIGLNLIYAGIYFLFKKPIFNTNRDLIESLNTYFSLMNQQISNIGFLQTHGLNKSFIKQIDKPFQDLEKTCVHQLNVEYAFNSTDKILLGIATTAVFIWGGNQILNGQMTVGELTIMTSYFNILMQANQYFFNLSGSIPQIEYFKNRMEEIFETSSIPESNDFIPEISTIEIENMSFAYPESNPVFTRYNQKFERGNIYVLKGHNGSGKTTFIKILLGLYKSEMEGKVLYNGKEIGSLDMTKIRKEKIAVSEQEPFLLKSSVLQNITHGANIPIEEIDRTIKMIDLEKVIENLEHGLDTNIEEGSTNLSGGEKQKIALARTILKNADLIILDEPTSAMDAEGKERFLEYIKDHAKDKIVIISTHDSDICEISDQVINFGENKGVHIESI